jgi:phosphoglycolate phosphatase
LKRPAPPHWCAAIIDLDGTLIDTLRDFEAALNATLEDLALPQRTRADIRNMVGKGAEHLVKCAIAPVNAQLFAINNEVKADHGLHVQALALYQAHYQRVNGQHAQVYPGVLEGLARLRQAGVRMACVTNKPTDMAVSLLKAKGLAGFFEVVFGGDAFARKKPDPLPLLKACAQLNSEPHHTLMVGDSSNDAQAARAAGCPVALLTYGYNHGEPVRQVDADWYVDSLEDLPLFCKLPV